MKQISENLVSIIMPAHNSQNYINESINSVLNQSYVNWELIIIDDASTDNTSKIIKIFSDNDKRIRCIKNKDNYGAAVSRNLGINNSKGDFVAFLDSDDLWIKDKLIKQISFMNSNNYFFTYTYYEVFDNSAGTQVMLKCPSIINRNIMAFSCPIGALTVIYNKKKLGNIFSADIKKRNDYALWLEILNKSNKAFCLKESLAKYRKSNKGLSGSGSYFSNLVYYWKVIKISYKAWIIIIPFSTPIYLFILLLKKKVLPIYNKLVSLI